MKQSMASILFAGFVLFWINGCGLKTAPVPPGAVIPASINDLTYRLDDKGVNLTWTYPPLSIQGAAIDNIREFKIFKAEKNEADYCPECPLKYHVVFSLNASRLKPGRHIKYSDTELQSGYHYFYMVQSHSGWNIHSHDSNQVDFIWRSPLTAPLNLQAEAGDRLITLNWDSPQTLVDGTPVTEPVGYLISRSVNGKKFKIFTPVIKQKSFTDGSVKNGVDYSYKIKAVFQEEETDYPGLSSEAITVRPVDSTPPAPPLQVRCVRTDSEVKIFWDNTTETDISAYRIYRRLADEPEAKLIGKSNGAAHTFVDKNPPGTAKIWYYSVTAVDNAENPNESVSSAEARVSRRN
jgi:fibronectin type 3 domain-containing protein